MEENKIKPLEEEKESDLEENMNNEPEQIESYLKRIEIRGTVLQKILNINKPHEAEEKKDDNSSNL
jgi:hypothetical protein